MNRFEEAAVMCCKQYCWEAVHAICTAVGFCAGGIMDLTCDYMQDVREKLVNERGRMMQELQTIPYLHAFPSAANFLLCKVTQGYDAKDVKLALAKQGVMVRHYAQHHLSGYIRISVGRPDQTEKLLAALKQL